MKTSEILGIGAGALAILVVILIAIQSQNEWNKFVVDHKCEITETEKSYSTSGWIDGKYMTQRVPERNKWVCQNGKVIWR